MEAQALGAYHHRRTPPRWKPTFLRPTERHVGGAWPLKKDIAGNVRIYRVDNLAPNANIVKDVLTKGEPKAAAGTAAQGGISGGINPANKAEWKELKKQAKREAKGYTPGIRYNKERFYTHRYTMSAEDRQCLFAHCYTDDELEAVKQLPELLYKLGKPRYEPLNTQRPNIRKKIEGGAIHFVVYEIEINGKMFVFKTETVKNKHGRFVIERPYSLKEKIKKQKKHFDLPLTRRAARRTDIENASLIANSLTLRKSAKNEQEEFIKSAKQAERLADFGDSVKRDIHTSFFRYGKGDRHQDRSGRSSARP